VLSFGAFERRAFVAAQFVIRVSLVGTVSVLCIVVRMDFFRMFRLGGAGFDSFSKARFKGRRENVRAR
jgi:hypothetical protein